MPRDSKGRYAKAADAVANDVFSNPAARMGAGTPSLAEATEYQLIRYTYDYWLMITLFRNHWLARRIVEKPAQDMCKAWPRLTCELTPDQIKSFDKTIAVTKTPAKILKTLKWARLFGGAGALMVIDGHEDILDQPLNADDINPGSYKGLIVFDRWSGISPEGNLASDINDPTDFGLPEFYSVREQNTTMFNVHASRILRFAGPDVPNPEYAANMYWGISVLEIVFEELRKLDNMSWSILQLMYRAQILTQKNPQLAALMSGANASGQAAQKFQQTMQAQNELLSNQSMLLLGEDAELQSHQYTFGGVSDVLQQFRAMVAGASHIPVSILFGQTPSGLGQTNDADIRIYEQEIAMNQNDELRPQLAKLYPVICMSEFGEIPDDLDFDFPSIRVLTEEQKAEMAEKGTAAILLPFSAGVTSQRLSLQELKQQSDVTGIFSNITDEDIDAADDKPQVPIEVESEEARAGSAEFEEGSAKDAAWNESDHPRAENGEFGNGGKGKESDVVTVNQPKRAPFVQEFLNTYTTSTKQDAYIKTVPTDKLKKGIEIIDKSKDLSAGSLETRKLMEKELNSRTKGKDGFDSVLAEIL